MSKSYDIFLSHSGAQKEFAEQLFTELSRQYGQYSVFFDKDSIKHGEPISSIILEYAKTCKLAVAVLSEEYLTRSKPPMLELAASYTASKNGTGVPCLLPVFLELKPAHAKSFEKQLEWKSTWDEWRRNEIMSDTPEPRTNRVEPTVWREALVKLLDTRGPVYKPHENRYKSAFFAENVARVIACKLDELSRTKVSYKTNGSAHQYKATDRSDSLNMENLIIRRVQYHSDRRVEYLDSPQLSDGRQNLLGPFIQALSSIQLRERASTSGETHTQFVCSSCSKYTEREESITERERLVEVRETSMDERERNLRQREADLTELRTRRGKDDKIVVPDWLVDHQIETGQYQTLRSPLEEWTKYPSVTDNFEQSSVAAPERLLWRPDHRAR